MHRHEKEGKIELVGLLSLFVVMVIHFSIHMWFELVPCNYEGIYFSSVIKLRRRWKMEDGAKQKLCVDVMIGSFFSICGVTSSHLRVLARLMCD